MGSRNGTSWSTSVLDRLTDLGGTAYLAVAVTFVAAYDFVRHRNLNVALFLLVVLAGVVLINNGLKSLVDRERPPVVHLVGTSGSSFPSGHSAAAAATWFALALVIARDWSRRGRAVAAGAAALISVAVAASRALLGVHWLTDVVAGTARLDVVPRVVVWFRASARSVRSGVDAMVSEALLLAVLVGLSHGIESL